jgi:hypothetical protein
MMAGRVRGLRPVTSAILVSNRVVMGRFPVLPEQQSNGLALVCRIAVTVSYVGILS